MNKEQTKEYYQWVKAMVGGKLNIPNEIVNHHWKSDISDAPLSAEKVNRAIRKNYHSELQNISWLEKVEQPLYTLEDIGKAHMAGQFNAGCKEPSAYEATAYIQSIKR